MRSFLEMVISTCLLVMVIFVEFGAGQNECRESRCGNHGTAIRFPFRLKDSQPIHCGYPGFDLSCTKTNDTMLMLPKSVNLIVKSINYKSQEIHVYDSDDCLPRQIPKLNLSASPFQFKEKHIKDFTLYCCPLTENTSNHCLQTQNYPCWQIPCLGSTGYQVYTYYSDEQIDDLLLFSCTKMFNISSVPRDMFNQKAKDKIRRLMWSEPKCGRCEAKGNKCRFKNNSIELGYECFRLQKEPKKGTSTKSIATCVILVFFFLVLAILAIYRDRGTNKIEKENQAKIEKFLEDYKALKPTRYSYADIKRITNKFKEKLGQGAYGTVFKGMLSNEILVVVKILNGVKGNGEEFTNEVGTMARIHHVNVVRLAGFCADGFRRALIYDYLPNDSLHKFISSANTKSHFLGWEKLQDIALGIAKGIKYLHQGCDQQILHFDIKPRNILLDQNLNPKISDFGLAKLCSKDQSTVSMSTARGTMGYVAPEVLSRNSTANVSYKSDVYSFGMLLLEMVGGSKNVDITMKNKGQVSFPEWTYTLLEQGKDVNIGIGEKGNTKIAKKLAIVGLWCIQWHPMDRSSMKIVVQMLEGEVDNLAMPPNPFASTATGPKRFDAAVPERNQHQELELISQLE